VGLTQVFYFNPNLICGGIVLVYVEGGKSKGKFSEHSENQHVNKQDRKYKFQANRWEASSLSTAENEFFPLMSVSNGKKRFNKSVIRLSHRLNLYLRNYFGCKYTRETMAYEAKKQKRVPRKLKYLIN